MIGTLRLILIGLALSLLLAACAPRAGTTASPPTSSPDPSTPTTGPPQGPQSPHPTPMEERDIRIITLLPRDAIPAIDDPVFVTADEAGAEYAPDEQVIGVVFNGEARAYSIALLSRREIVNDNVGGHKIAVTW